MADWLYTDPVAFGGVLSYPLSFRYAYYVESTDTGRRLNLQIQLMNAHTTSNYTDTLYACGSKNAGSSTIPATLTANNVSLITQGSMNLQSGDYPIQVTARQTWYSLGYLDTGNPATFTYDFGNETTVINVSFNGMFCSADLDATAINTVSHTFYFNSTSGGGSSTSGSLVAGLKTKLGNNWLSNASAYAKQENVWKRIIKGYVKIGNEWRKIKVYTADVILRGAVNETLTLTDSNGNVTYIATGADGLSEITTLTCGTYTVTGDVSTPYSRTIDITADGTYNACPDGAIYWYGTEIYPMTVRLSAETTYSAADKNTNDIYIFATHSGSSGRTCVGQAITTNTIDTSSYDNIKVIVACTTCTGSGNKWIDNGYSTANTTETLMTGARITAVSDKQTYSTASPKTSVYVGSSFYANTGGYTTRTSVSGYVYAIYME